MATVNGSDTSDVDDDDALCCFICLGGTDESWEPLTRECSCRGTMGYVHRSCLDNYLEEMKKKGYLFLMRYKNITLHNILLDVLKLSLLCLIGYSMALQSVKIWEECLLSLFKLFHNKALQSVKIWEECLLLLFKLFYQCVVICAFWGGDLCLLVGDHGYMVLG